MPDRVGGRILEAAPQTLFATRARPSPPSSIGTLTPQDIQINYPTRRPNPAFPTGYVEALSQRCSFLASFSHVLLLGESPSPFHRESNRSAYTHAKNVWRGVFGFSLGKVLSNGALGIVSGLGGGQNRGDKKAFNFGFVVGEFVVLENGSDKDMPEVEGRGKSGVVVNVVDVVNEGLHGGLG